MSKWNTSMIPDQKGRVIIITGATSGLGKETARVLAEKNATVVLAIRNVKKGEAVVMEFKKTLPHASFDVRALSLDSLNSIKEFAAGILKSYDRVDVLINNAGVMACPFSKTTDGFEIQMGVNHLGHFALTGLLMPVIQKTQGSRIVATSSQAHRQGDINFNDLQWKNRKYVTGKAYSDSKIANLYFAYELARKLKDQPNAPVVTAAHPGWTITELQRHSVMFRILNPIFGQKVDQGALPTLRAATDEQAKSGDYFGPKGFMEMKGAPVLVQSNALSHDKEKAEKLWSMSESLTGVTYP